MFALSGTPYVFGQSPVANFTADVRSGCAPLTVRFTDLSSGTPTEWNWEFSNGTLASVKNPVVTFSAPGTYSVKLVVRNADGIDQTEKIDYITVFPSPSPNFSGDITLGCVPVTVKFTDLSTSPVGSITAWAWEFGDGTSSNQRNPSHAYSNTGFYTVSLNVTSSTGCTRRITKTRYIRVVDGVSTDFNFSQFGSCKPPSTVNFQNQSSGPGNISYTWNFGNGQTSTATNPSTVYNAPGTYTVRLNARSDLGCGGSTQKTVTITSTNTDFTGPTTVCVGEPAIFQNNSSAQPESSYWNFGDGTTSAQTNPEKTYLVPGTYTIQMNNGYSNCVDSVRKTITVVDKPVVDFTADKIASCSAPTDVRFTDMTPGATSWLWDFGDGTTSTEQNPIHQYTNYGNYTVSLTANTSTDCGNTTIKTDFIKIKETTVTVTPGGGCVPFTYTPQATIESLDPVASYLWDFGDGTTSTLQNPPPHTYNSAGSYTISLTITTVSGCTKTVTIPNGVKTGTPPTVSFTATPLNACASETISFAGQAVTSPGADVQWFWDFGDGTNGTGQNTTHTFIDTGALNVSLTVTNNGCPGSFMQVLQVNPPIAQFEHTVNCTTRAVTFTNSSLVNPGLTPLTYLWNMGDPANTEFTTAVPPAPFSYPSPGTYNVTLTVTNGPCSFTVTNPVKIVDEQPDFSINKNPVCTNELFTLTSNNPAANILTYAWTVGTATLPGSTKSIDHQLTTEGTYDVSLTITDINGCTNTKAIADYITVRGPVAKFEPATTGGCLNKTTTFNDLSTSASSSLVKWDWNFGDGTQQSFTAPPFTHIYSKVGRYRVSVKVTDANGCADSDTLPVNLLVTNPRVGFVAPEIYCPQAPLLFSDTSSGAGLQYFWEFGDGGSSTLQNPRHNYPLGDSVYSVKLKIRDISGCEDSVLKTDYIKIRSPKAAFDIQDTTTICPPLRTTFTFKGTDYQSFHWEFGDGGSTTLQNPSYFYSDYGHYTPKLYLQGVGGCIDSAEASVSIYDPYSFTKINYGPVAPTCNSLNVDFNLVVPPSFRFVFYFGDGTLDSSGRTSFSHFYSRPSFNTPRIVLFDSISGCEISINGSPRIDVLGAVPLFGKDKKEFCDEGTVTFKNFTTKNEPIISTVWDFGDGTTSNAENPSHTFTQPGLYPVKLEVTTQSNCTKAFIDTVRVYRTPAPSIQGRDTICLNTAEPFNGILAVPDTLTNWQWNFGNGQASSQQNTNATFTTAGDYTLQLTASNKLNCSSSTSKNIHVAPPPTATPEQDPITIPVGTGTNISMNYTGNITSYNWLPTTRLSCTDCPLPYANPQYTTKYTVEIEDRYGCRNSGDITIMVVCGKENVVIPNTFSPNGDGRNEVFYPKGTGLFRIKSMRVFNRWGEIVFEKNEFTANDASAGWNGTFKGKAASPDVYIYTMEILCENNVIIPVKGNVTLLR